MKHETTTGYDAGRQMKRWHVFTTQGRKITWALDKDAARVKVTKAGFTVLRVVSAPNPLNDVK